MGFFDYKSDDGNTYKVKLDASNTTSMGGTTATATNWYPRGWQLRYVLCENATHGRRKVAAPDVTDSHWLANDTLPLEVVGSVLAVDFTITARIGEKRTSRG
jgi:hypothetical protein